MLHFFIIFFIKIGDASYGFFLEFTIYLEPKNTYMSPVFTK